MICHHLFYPPDADRYVVDGERDCTEPATFISCDPYSGSPTCAKHKCRCAQPIDAQGKTRADRRREAKLAEELVLEKALSWYLGADTAAGSVGLRGAVRDMVAAREAVK